MSFLNKIMMIGRESSYPTDLAMTLTESTNINSLIYKLTNTSSMTELVMNYADKNDINTLSEYLTEVAGVNGTKKLRLEFSNIATKNTVCNYKTILLFIILVFTIKE